MRGSGWRAARDLSGLCAAAALAWSVPATADEAAVARGKYLTFAGGCITCHTDAKNRGPLFAGGGPLKTPFGTFYAPNITPDREHGIGDWTDRDFIRALREGVGPHGANLFPVFPYTSFTNITDRDLLDIKAYLFSLDPVDRPNREHEVIFPFGWRFPITFWKWLNFEPGPYRPDPARSASWNRGAYLVTALVHCGECHTPRAIDGSLEMGMWMAGAADGPEGELAPNITPDTETGIGDWSPDEIATYLSIGMTPEGDFAGSLMADVIEDSTGNLTDEDIAAIVEYVRSLPPIRHRVRKTAAD